MEFFFLFLFIFTFNFFLFLKFDIIAKNFEFFDKPDGKLKKHSKPTSLIGGLIILLNLYLIIYFLKIINIDGSIFSENFIYAFLLICTFFYLIGLFDDLKNLAPNKKLFFLILSIIITIYFFPEMHLEHIKISFLNNIYSFEYSFIFLVLSFALLANAINMFDGINLQLLLFSILLFFIFILKGIIPIFFTLLIIPLIFLSFLNFQNKVFLGDGGAYLISAILGCTFIYQYNEMNNYFFGDEVFVILIIPAIDMLRLFIVRLINNKHPFKGDLNHLHHIVLKFTKDKNITVSVTILLCSISSLLLLLNLKTYYILVITLLLYFISIFYFKTKTK